MGHKRESARGVRVKERDASGDLVSRTLYAGTSRGQMSCILNHGFLQEYDAAMGHYNKAIELDPTVNNTSPSSPHISL
jgi:hypothetical protein